MSHQCAVRSRGLGLFHSRLPGTSVPGFHIPPLRGWLANLVQHALPTARFDSEFHKSAICNPLFL
jgi:hypothetical protein